MSPDNQSLHTLVRFPSGTYPFAGVTRPYVSGSGSITSVGEERANLSDVINRPKSTDFNTKRVLLLVFSVARKRFDDSLKNQTSNTCFSWLNMQILYFPLCRGKVTVEPGIEICLLM